MGPRGQALAAPEALRSTSTDRENQHPGRGARGVAACAHGAPAAFARAAPCSALRPAWWEVLWLLVHQTTAGLGRGRASRALADWPSVSVIGVSAA